MGVVGVRVPPSAPNHRSQDACTAVVGSGSANDLLTNAEDEAGDPLRCVVVQARGHMAVDVERDADVGVPESLLNTFGWPPAASAIVARPCSSSCSRIRRRPS
jgi:hypothetical protein